MRRLVILWVSILPLLCLAQNEKHYSPEVETVLKKAGTNRTELEKALEFFYKSGDPLKAKAIEFLVANMDIHYSASYFWADSSGKKVSFNELDYPDFATSLQAFEAVKAMHSGIHPIPVKYNDIDSIKADYLIDNVEGAFEAWKSPWAKDISFNNFCEYILPYRASIEPLQDWRKTYQQKFSWINDSARGKTTDDALMYFATDFKKWFGNTYDIESRKEPLPRLGALQLLHRKKGPCEDIADLTVFALRSQGFPVTNDMVSYWATSSGKHFFNSTFNTQLQPIRFDVSTSTVRLTTFAREPAKVIRTTFAKQAGVLASFEIQSNIPEGFMRSLNYIDVTKEYWETKDVYCKLFPSKEKSKVAYACVFNFFDWRPTWWGKTVKDSVAFTNMCKGAVFLPAYYINGKLQPAGFPVAVGYNNQLVLAPDMLNKRKVNIEQQDKYLIFRHGKRYKLYYWNNAWKLVGEQKAEADTKALVFENVPRNSLLLLVPEYTQRKERPFIIMDNGERLWW
jgi:hypothetical protein